MAALPRRIAALPAALRGSLAAYLAEHRELEGAGHLIGEPVDTPGVQASARKSSAPDPMVYIEVAGRAFRTTLSPGQFQPTWRFPLTFEANLDATTLVHITVVDWDGPAQADRAPRQGLGGGHGAGDQSAGRAGEAAGVDPVGP